MKLPWLKNRPKVFIQLDPAWPHAGFSAFSPDKSAFPCAICVEMEEADARAQFTGKVLAFERLTNAQRAGLWERSLKVDAEKLKTLLR